MANAETYKGAEPQFFPLQGPRVQRGADVRTPTDAANVDYPPISKRLTQSNEDAIWAQYEATPPSTDAMEKASSIQSGQRWLIPAIVGATVAIGIGYAAITDRPAAIDNAASEAPATDTSASALMGGAPMVGDPTVSTQSTFDSPQPTTVSPPPQAAEPSAVASAQAERAAPAPRATWAAPAAPTEEPATPAPTYSSGESPATTLPAPAAEANPLVAPTPLPSAPPQEPSLNLDLAPPSETVPAPGSVPENAQTPQ